jgi:hypothetical protein
LPTVGTDEENNIATVIGGDQALVLPRRTTVSGRHHVEVAVVVRARPTEVEPTAVAHERRCKVRVRFVTYWVPRPARTRPSVRLGPIGAAGEAAVFEAAVDAILVIDHLGSIERVNPAIELRIESFCGAVTGIVDSSVLTVYTLDGRMRLHMLANEPGPSDTTIRDEAERGVGRLLRAIDG